MNASVRRIWLLLTAAVVLGCDSWDRDVPGFVVRDSAGIAIAESLKPAWMAGEGWQISTEPILDVGQMAGEEVYLFNRIRDVTRSGTGNVVVANGAPQEIRIFDSSGAFLRSIGRGGDGPDEFGRLAAVQARAADTVVALDVRRPRILAFGPIGNLLWSSTLATGTGSSMGSPASLVDGSFVVGWVANEREVLTEFRARPGTIFQWMVALVRYTPGGLADTIGVFAGADGAWVETPEVSERMVLPPLGRRELGFSAHV